MVYIKSLVFITFLSYDHEDILDMKCLDSHMTRKPANKDYIVSLMGC